MVKIWAGRENTIMGGIHLGDVGSIIYRVGWGGR